MPMTVQAAIAEQTAEAVIEGVELAAPVAAELARHKARSALHSRAARMSGVISGGLLFAFTYATIARHRRLQRMEEKLHKVADEVVDDDD